MLLLVNECFREILSYIQTNNNKRQLAAFSPSLEDRAIILGTD